jgi:hypothetical protein
MPKLRAQLVARRHAVPAVAGLAGSSATPPWPISVPVRCRGTEGPR